MLASKVKSFKIDMKLCITLLMSFFLVVMSGCKVTGGEDQLSVNSTTNLTSELGLISSDCASEAPVDELTFGCKLDINLDPTNELGYWEFTAKNSCDWLSLGTDSGLIIGQPQTSHIGDCLLSARYLNYSANQYVDEINIPIKVIPSHYLINSKCETIAPPIQDNTFNCEIQISSQTKTFTVEKYTIDAQTNTCLGFNQDHTQLGYKYFQTMTVNQTCILGIEILLKSGEALKYHRQYNISAYF